MHANDWKALDRKLHENVAEERKHIVVFLRDLNRFDEERGWQRAGYRSLWVYCLESLHLRESAAGRRIGGMHLVRRYPQLEAPLGDGRLCLSTLGLLGKVLTEENVDEVIAQAAWLTKRQTEELVVSIQPRTAPRDGIRKLAAPVARPAPAPAPEPTIGSQPSLSITGDPPRCNEGAQGRGEGATRAVPSSLPPSPSVLSLPPRPPSRPTVEPVSADQWSLRVTLDRPLNEDLETLKCLLSHKIPDGDLTEVVREAVRCAIEKHGKRKGAVRPERTRKTRASTPRPAGERQPISAEVRRQIWERDGGRCTYVSKDGHRCESRWQLELDHVESARLGGPTTADDLRIRCRPHNVFHAEQTLGRAYMAKFRSARRPASTAGEPTTPGGSMEHRGRPPDGG